jgi:outer membrane protein assembly factor BamA
MLLMKPFVASHSVYPCFKTSIIFFLLFVTTGIRISAQEDHISDTLVLRKANFSGYPYIFYTPETRLAFGAGGIFVFYADSTKEINPSKITLSGHYSTNRQYSFEFTPQFFFLKNKLYIEMPTSFGYYITKFFSAGNDRVEEGNEDYSSYVFNSTLVLQTPAVLFFSDRTGFLIDINQTQIVDKEQNELLLDNSVKGSNGGLCLGLGYDGVWDTRDNLFYPTRGSYQYFKLTLYPHISDYAFYTFELDVRKYFHISRRAVLAYNFYFSMAGGETPFYKLPALGGQHRMRGYYEGQYRDNAYTVMQLEYRQFVARRIGFVIFSGVGDVANSLIEYDLKKFKLSYGCGLRYLFSKAEKINLRFDAGFGKHTHGLYFGIEEAF